MINSKYPVYVVKESFEQLKPFQKEALDLFAQIKDNDHAVRLIKTEEM